MNFACLLQTEGDGVVGGGVTGVQRGDDVDARGQFTALRGDSATTEVQKAHALEAQARGQFARLLHQFGAGLDAIDVAASFSALKYRSYNDETEVGLARAVVGQREGPRPFSTPTTLAGFFR
jgi:hypothetical protein